MMTIPALADVQASSASLSNTTTSGGDDDVVVSSGVGGVGGSVAAVAETSSILDTAMEPSVSVASASVHSTPSRAIHMLSAIPAGSHITHQQSRAIVSTQKRLMKGGEILRAQVINRFSVPSKVLILKRSSSPSHPILPVEGQPLASSVADRLGLDYLGPPLPVLNEAVKQYILSGGTKKVKFFDE
jgi:hypothetical protein